MGTWRTTAVVKRLMELNVSEKQTVSKLGRNHLCHCGSGKKYKQCCLHHEEKISFELQSLQKKIAKWFGFGLRAYEQGHLSLAVRVCQKVLRLVPDHSECLHLMALASLHAGQDTKALGYVRRALEISPFDANCHNTLGVILGQQARLDDAAASYRQALSIQPDYAEAYANLGEILRMQGRIEEALQALQKAIAIKPDYAEAHWNLGLVRQFQGNMDGAITSFRRATLLKPNYAEACGNLGAALFLKGELREAEEWMQRTLSIRPDIAEVHCNLGFLRMTESKEEEAVTCFRAALQIKTDYLAAHTNLVMLMEASPRFSAEEIFREHRRFFQPMEASLLPAWQPFSNNCNSERKIKIGYVSGDFRTHSSAFFMEPIFERHDKSQFALYAYNNSALGDSVTERIAKSFDHWSDCYSSTDEQLTSQIQADGIDILVDLSGMTANNRLAVFARKPAPIQVTWVGYPSTSGLQAMDYRLTDHFMDPPGLTEQYHTETLVRLSAESTYQPPSNCPEVNVLPALTSSGLMLACLNNPTKINQPVVDLWAKILKALPAAKLMLSHSGNDVAMIRLMHLFEHARVDADRLVFQPKLAIHDYLALHHNIDLALDCFPYNGGTTTSHSLWMGVPVVTLVGNRSIARCGVSLMMRAGLPEFVAQDEQGYFECVLRWVNDLPHLNEIRNSLRDRILSQPSNSPDQYTREVEAAFRNMWRTWCQRQS